MKNKYDITIAIVIYQPNYEVLQKTITSVLQCRLNIYLYLIDNSPQVNDFSNLLFDNRVEYIYLNSNRGFGAGHNAIMKQKNKLGKYHLVLNPDVCFTENTLETIFNYMERNIDVGCLMPKVLFPNGELQYLAKMLPRPIDFFLRMFCPIKCIKDKINYSFEMHFADHDNIINSPYLSGCFMFLRYSVIEEIGVFDEGIFMYGEDTDLTRRVYKRYKTIYFPQATIIHNYEGASHKNLHLLIIHIKAIIYYMNKWGWFFDKERKKINKKLIKEYSKK